MVLHGQKVMANVTYRGPLSSDSMYLAEPDTRTALPCHSRLWHTPPASWFSKLQKWYPTCLNCDSNGGRKEKICYCIVWTNLKLNKIKTIQSNLPNRPLQRHKHKEQNAKIGVVISRMHLSSFWESKWKSYPLWGQPQLERWRKISKAIVREGVGRVENDDKAGGFQTWNWGQTGISHVGVWIGRGKLIPEANGGRMGAILAVV